MTELTSLTLAGFKHFIYLKFCSIKIICCGGRSAERERQWNFPQQSWGVPRRGEPAVRQPSPSARDNQTRQEFQLSSSALLPPKLLVYIGKQGHLWGTFHSCTDHIKGQVVMRFIVTGVYDDHALSTCKEIKRANQKFWQTTYATPSSRLPGAILALNHKASPSFLSFPI